ncbi:MAG: Fic family protein [Streptococcaceae bacterium]|nr:Fic family protein [Streptococcaceae bacterium]
MKTFDYSKLEEIAKHLEIVNLVSDIREHRGKQRAILRDEKKSLERLEFLSFVDAVDYGNSLDGIRVNHRRLQDLITGVTIPQDDNEKKILGYAEALKFVENNYLFIQMSANHLLQLHRTLNRHLKKSENHLPTTLDEVLSSGKSSIQDIRRLQPNQVLLLPEELSKILLTYQNALDSAKVDPLITIVATVFDFLTTQPFTNSNARIGRLLLLLLLFQNDYLVGKYISIDRFIEEENQRYQTLLFELLDPHTQPKNYIPFVQFTLEIIEKAYSDFESRFCPLDSKTKLSSKYRIYEVVKHAPEPLKKETILTLVPEYSKKTVERKLGELVKDNELEKVGKGRATAYTPVQKRPVDVYRSLTQTESNAIRIESLH